MQRPEDTGSLFEGKSFARIYHYHIRKCGGTSLNQAFFRLSGQDPKELYARINENGLIKAGGIRYVGWQRPLIAEGNWDYGFAHAAFHNVSVPADTYTFCVLRDPAARVLSHYKMLLYMRDHEPNHSGYIREASWIEAGFDGFLERASRQELLRQVFMFSRNFDVGEALENLGRVNRVMLLDDRFAEDFDGLRGDTSLALEYVHERAAKVDFQPTATQLERLHSLLEPEYRLIEKMRKVLRRSPANEHETHESVTMSDTPRKENVPADPIEKAYRDLWKKKLNDDEWLKNDGLGRVEYAANLLRPSLRPEHRVLDIGCGRGTLGIKLERQKGMFGVDLAPEAVEKANELYEDARVLNIDAEPLPWSDNSFEFVVYLDVIEHVFDPRVGLREIRRVLKPDGKLLLSTPNILAHIEKMRETRRFPKTSGDPEPYDGGHLHFFTYQDIHDLLKLTGFTESQSVSRFGGNGDHEFRDKMVWVVGSKGVEQPAAKAYFSSDPEVRKTVNVNPGRRFSIPTAVVTYNRPWHTEQVLNALRDQGIQRLYLFSDAPRVQEDEEKVGQVRELLRSVDWADVELVERTTNYGLARSVTGAANHVFAKHDRILVLEDDVVPFPGLFPFVEKALDKYEDNPRVTGISGYSIRQPEEIRRRYPYDAYFFPRISSQGWATWKSRWDRFDPDLSRLMERASKANLDITIGGTDLVRNLKQALNGRDVWTMNWVLGAMLDEGVTLYPAESQIRNVGMDGSGMNSGTTQRFNVDDPTRMPDRLPDEIFIDPDLAATFYSYYDLRGTQRNPNVDRIGPHPVKRLSVNEPDEQITSLDSINAEADDDPNAIIEAAVLLMDSGQPVAALARFDRVLANEGAVPNLNLVRAVCLQRLDRIEDALAATRAELADYSSNRDAEAFEQILVRQLGQNGNAHNGTSRPVSGNAVAKESPSTMQVAPAEPLISGRSDNDLIVFVSDEPRTREAKLAHGLTRAGKQVVLLHKKPPTFDASRYFVEARTYTTPTEAVELAKAYRPLAFHVFSNWNFDTALAVIEARPGPVLFDDYDVMTGMLREDVIARKHPGKPGQERFCLENADGLVARHLELRYLRRELGFELPPLLFAVDGCWADPDLRAEEKLSSSDGAVHFTTVGNFNPGAVDAKPSEVYVYELARILADCGHHYHIHPSHSATYLKTKAELDRQGFDERQRRNIHLHEPLPPQELIPTISAYDYGLHVLSQSVDLMNERFTPRKPELAAANKLYDFMDAGLHILAHSGRFQQFLIQRYGFGRVLRSFDELKSLTIPDPVPSIPDSLRVESIATRMIAFYEKIRAQAGNRFEKNRDNAPLVADYDSTRR